MKQHTKKSDKNSKKKLLGLRGLRPLFHIPVILDSLDVEGPSPERFLFYALRHFREVSSPVNFEIATNHPPTITKGSCPSHSPPYLLKGTYTISHLQFPSSFHLLYTPSLHNISLLVTLSSFLFSWFSPPLLITPSLEGWVLSPEGKSWDRRADKYENNVVLCVG
jgi:hypothetical protein